jgi:hypothetical protein
MKQQWFWTWSGKSFGYNDGDALRTHDGKHIGQFYGNEIYAQNGNYLGEIKNNNRLIVDKNKKLNRKAPFMPYVNNVPHINNVNYVGFIMYVGYEDFPEPKFLNKQ